VLAIEYPQHGQQKRKKNKKDSAPNKKTGLHGGGVEPCAPARPSHRRETHITFSLSTGTFSINKNHAKGVFLGVAQATLRATE
jgi:hypothetical protein